MKNTTLCKLASKLRQIKYSYWPIGKKIGKGKKKKKGKGAKKGEKQKKTHVASEIRDRLFDLHACIFFTLFYWIKKIHRERENWIL